MLKTSKEHQGIGVKGAFSYQLIENDKVLLDVDEQPNLILDAYLDGEHVRPNAQIGTIVIGAGVVTPPAYTDTDMGNQIKHKNAGFSIHANEVVDSTGGKLMRYTTTVEFTDFSGESVSEIGCRSGYGGTGTLKTRALLKDSSGNPTTITVNEGQTLRITYSLYVFLPLFVSSGTVTTPHGDIQWEYVLGDYSNSSLTNANLAGGKYGGVSAFLGHDEIANSSASGAIQRVVDIASRTATMTATFPATTSDRVLGQANTYNSSGKGYLIHVSQFAYWIKVVGPRITLPANYDFTITWQITWGRLS